jgi:phosphonate transport system substrate-binding protein
MIKRANLGLSVLMVVVLLFPMGLSVATAAPLAQEETYTVKLGDNLWTLAEKYLGNGAAYWAIVGATNKKAGEDTTFAHIENPSLIHPGWKLLIPGAEGAEAVIGLGTEANPIIWSFVPSGEMERVAAGAESIADLIYKETGLVIKTNVATEYAGVIEAMCADPPKAHMGSLATFAYVLAAGKGCAEAELVSVRFGSPTYNGQIIVRADSGITSITDLEGKTFCRPDPLSTSGWIIPMLTLRAAGIDPDTDLAEVVDAGSHDAVAAAVYNGDCDAGATYVDARTRIEADYPDVMEQVIVIEFTEDIPNDGVQYETGFPRALRDRINAALLAIAETEEGQEALDTAYQWAGLIRVDDTFYDPFRQVLSASGLDIEELQE